MNRATTKPVERTAEKNKPTIPHQCQRVRSVRNEPNENEINDYQVHGRDHDNLNLWLDVFSLGTHHYFGIYFRVCIIGGINHATFLIHSILSARFLFALR